MARNISDFNGGVVAPGGDYPFGNIKNNPSGTVIDETSNADIQQHMQKLMFEGGVTPNGDPDNDANGYQIFAGLQGVINSYGQHVIINLIGSVYDPTKVYVLAGCATRADDGFVFYDGEIYAVAGNSGPSCGPGTVDTLVISTTLSNGLKVMSVTCGVSGSGVTDFVDIIYLYAWEDVSTYSGTYIADAVNPIAVRLENGATSVRLRGKSSNSAPGFVAALDQVCTLAAAYWPTQDRQFVIACPSGVGVQAIVVAVLNDGRVFAKGNLTPFDNTQLHFDISYGI